jgi:hypothetical protein
MKKICKNCKQELGGGSFYKSNLSKDGLTSLCRKCNSISGDRNDEEKYGFPPAAIQTVLQQAEVFSAKRAA